MYRCGDTKDEAFLCDDSTFCSSSRGVCVSGGANGDWCGEGMLCGKGFYCNPINDIVGVCDPLVPEGGACWEDTIPMSLCAAGLDCIGGKCKYRGQREGQSCIDSKACGTGLDCIRGKCVSDDIPTTIRDWACEK